MTRWLCPSVPAKACFVLTSELLGDIPWLMFTAHVLLGWLDIAASTVEQNEKPSNIVQVHQLALPVVQWLQLHTAICCIDSFSHFSHTCLWFYVWTYTASRPSLWQQRGAKEFYRCRRLSEIHGQVKASGSYICGMVLCSFFNPGMTALVSVSLRLVFAPLSCVQIPVISFLRFGSEMERKLVWLVSWTAPLSKATGP